MSIPPDWQALPYTDEDRPWMRLASVLLLAAALGAHAGDADEIAWMRSPMALELAKEMRLPAWPPAPYQLASRAELEARVLNLGLDLLSEEADPLEIARATQRARRANKNAEPGPLKERQ